MSTHSPGERVSGKIVKTIVREIGQKDAVEVRCELQNPLECLAGFSQLT